jgi:Regulatory protein YrvL
MSKHNDSFRNLKWNEKVVVVTALSLLIIIALSFVAGLFFFGFTGIFSLLGVQFDSFHAIFLFVLFYFLLGILSDVLSKVIIMLITPKLTRATFIFFVKLILECTFSWFAFHTVDEFMSSITIPFKTEWIVVLLLFIVEAAFDGKKEWKK